MVDGTWLLQTVDRRIFIEDKNKGSRIDTLNLPQWSWQTEITSEMISAALLRPDRMKTIDLFQYMRHLADNGQNAQRYEIQFWRKVFYPLSCLVMLSLALPFAYLHFRSGKLATLAHGCSPRPDLQLDLTGYFWVACFASIRKSNSWPLVLTNKPSFCLRMAPVTRFGGVLLRLWHIE
jgi:lipopolysaccharide export system permease protein